MRIRHAIALCALAVVNAASASDYQGFISNFTPHNGKVFIAVGEGNFNSTNSSCAVSGKSMLYSIDPATPFGRTLIAAALSAKLSGRMVYVTGDGICGPVPMFGGNGEGATGLDLKG